VGGEDLDLYAWNEDMGPIGMNSLTQAVRPDTVAPVHQTRKLAPFGLSLAWFNETGISFSPGEPSARAWAGAYTRTAACPAGTEAQYDAGGAELSGGNAWACGAGVSRGSGALGGGRV